MSAPSLKPTPLDRTNLPTPGWRVASVRPSANLSLRQIMILLVYCSVLSLIGRHVYLDRSWLGLAYLGIGFGVGVAYLGIWLVARLGKAGYTGWVVFVVGFGLVTASTISYLAIPGILILIGVLITLHVQYRRNQQSGLLWVLAVASERQIPLAPGVAAYAEQTQGIYRDRAQTLAVALERGEPLSKAINRVNRVVPWDAPILIQVGERVGRLAAALRESAETRSRRQTSIQVVFDRVGYLIVVVLLIEVVLGVTAFYTVPHFAAILKDFQIPSPMLTELLFWSGGFIDRFAIIMGLVQLIAFVAIVLVLWTQGLQGLPVLGRLFRLRHKSLMLRSLNLVVEAGQPLARGFEVLATEYPSQRIRRRVVEANHAVQAGADWVLALRGVGLISAADVGLLQAATRAGNLSWALRALAETGEHRFAYRLEVASQLGFIGAILTLGGVVLLISIALFLPLIDMIEGFS